MKLRPMAILFCFLATLIVMIGIRYAVLDIHRDDPIDAAWLRMTGVRDEFIAINQNSFIVLGDRAELVNVGSAPNCVCGDPINLALGKIHRNLDLIVDMKFQGAPLPKNLGGP